MWDAQVSGLVGRLPEWLSKIRQFVIFHLVQVNSLYLGFIQVIMSIIHKLIGRLDLSQALTSLHFMSISDIEGKNSPKLAKIPCL